MASAGQLRLGTSGSLREGLADAVGAMVRRAERMAGLARTRPAYAVHEWRKAMRRARAVLRLVRPLLAKEDHASIAGAFRTAQRAASALRDSDVLLPVLVELASDRRADEGERQAVRKVRRRLQLAGGARGRRERAAAATLGRHLGPIRTARARFERALPLELSGRDVQSGLAASHRRAVKALRRSRKDDADEAFHDLRKTVKVLHYQAELLSAGKGAEKRRKKLSKLAESQGRVTDLLLVRAELTPEESHQLHDLLERAIARRRKPADRQARKLLAEGPKTFGREVFGGSKSATSPKRR